MDILEPDEQFYASLKNKNLINFYQQLSIDDFFCTINFDTDTNIFDGKDKFFTPQEKIPKEFCMENDFTDFTYILNEKGFRSKKFSNFNLNNTNILTSGCSHSFGVGIPNEYTWTELLKNKIDLETNKKHDFYNLSLPGSSLKLIIRNILTFINKIGKPDYIIVLIPNISRYIYFNKKNFSYSNSTWWRTSQLKELDEDDKQNVISYQIRYNHANNLFDSVLYIHFLEMLCNLNNIKLIWSSWSIEDQKVFNNLPFKNFIINPVHIHELSICMAEIKNMPKLEQMAIIELKKRLDKKNIDKKPYWTTALDLRHPGLCWNEYISDMFFKKMKEIM